MVDFELRRGVGSVGGRQAARGEKCCRIDGFAGARRVCQPAVIGALHINVERCQVMVGNVDGRRIGGSVVPHAVIARDQRSNHIGRSEKRVPAVSRIGGRYSRGERQAR